MYILHPIDSSREDTTRQRAQYLLQLPLLGGVELGRRHWVEQALALRVVEGRADTALVNHIWMHRHYLGGQPTPPKVKRLSYLGQLTGLEPGDAGAAVACTVALMGSGSTAVQALRRELGLHPCSILELVRCWRADDLGLSVAPGLMLHALRRIVGGGNGVRSLAEEWSARKLTHGLTAEPLILLTYADPALGHDGGLYRGAGAVSLGATGTGKLAFAWPLVPGLREPLRRLAHGHI